MRGSAVGDRLLPLLLVGPIMEHTNAKTKNLKKNVKMNDNGNEKDKECKLTNKKQNDTNIPEDDIIMDETSATNEENANLDEANIEDQAMENGTPAEEIESQPVIPSKPLSDLIKVGIISSGYPDKLLTTDQQKKIKEAVIEKIIDLDPNIAVKPTFARYNLRAGWLCIACGNQETAEWLKDILSEIVPWEGAQLEMLTEDELPHHEVFMGYFPASADYSDDKILKLINSQNTGFSTVHWKILKRTNKGQIVTLSLALDGKSAALIKEVGAINYGFGKVKITVQQTQPATKKQPQPNQPKSNQPNKKAKPNPGQSKPMPPKNKARKKVPQRRPQRYHTSSRFSQPSSFLTNSIQPWSLNPSGTNPWVSLGGTSGIGFSTPQRSFESWRTPRSGGRPQGRSQYRY